MSQQTGRPLDGYIRVSDVHGRAGDSFISPDTQREKITAWATIHNHEVGFMEPELDVSGGELKRPVLDQIMDRIRSGESGGIAIARLDRFSRAGVGDALALIEEIKTAGGVFGCVEPQIDTSDPVMGEFILTIFLALARMERQRIGANWGDAKLHAVERNIHISAQAPFGYIRPRGEPNPRTGRRPTLPLVPDPATAWMVAEAFRMKAAGASQEALRRFMVDNNAPTVRGHDWAASTVQTMLHNRVYLGEARGAGGGHFQKDAHPALVDEATWLAAQQRGRRFTLNDSGGLLRGLVRCGSCRYTMQQRAPAAEKGAIAYFCSSRVGCPHPALIIATGRNGNLGADEVVVSMVRERDSKRDKEILFDRFDPYADVEKDQFELERLKQDVERDLRDEELQALLGRERWKKYLADLTRRVDAKEAEITEKLRLLGGPAGKLSVGLWEKWDSGEMTLAEKREHLAGALQAVFVNPEGGRTVGRTLDPALRRSRISRRLDLFWANDARGELTDVPRQGRGKYNVKPWPFPVRPDPDEVGVVASQPAVEDAGEAVG